MSRSMEILSQNLINTTTMIRSESGTGLTQYLFDRNRSLGYATVGYSGATASTISIEFSVPTVISVLLLQETNLEAVSGYYDSMTANSLFSLTGSSDGSLYIPFNSITVSSFQLQLNGATGERNIGEMVLCDRLLSFERNPAVSGFTPSISRKQVEHEMPDGGRVLFNIRDKYRASLNWKFITPSFHNNLLSIYEMADPFYFVPFPTTSAWDGRGHEVVWVGDFDFKHSTNDRQQGYSGGINMRETPSG